MIPMPDIPDNTPEPGYYYHFKHDPHGTLNNYAYEVLGVGHHTEDDSRPEDSYMVVYRPLYKDSSLYKNGKMFALRPLAMFMEDVERDGMRTPRFRAITNPGIIAELDKIRTRMYGEAS